MPVEVLITYNRFPDLARKIPDACHEIVGEVGEAVLGTIVDSMSWPKSGRMYGTHQASAPGEPPAIDTGALLSSLKLEVQKTTARVYSDLQDGRPEWLEYGTSRMAARPYMTPAAEAHRKTFVDKCAKLEVRLR